MKLTLFVVHGSHPCATVIKALELKGLRDYRVVEWPPPMHAPMQRLLFDARTVPALKIDGEKVQGSRAIMRRLDALRPEPRLYPEDPATAAKVVEADEWGDRVLQPVARELIWVGFLSRPAAMVSYVEHSKIPLPAPMIRASAPLIARVQSKLNKTDPAVAARVLQALPGQLDVVDGWIAEGRIGDVGKPNAADLQIFSTLRLLLTMGDLAPMLDARPAGAAARAFFPQYDGAMPAGVLPAAA